MHLKKINGNICSMLKWRWKKKKFEGKCFVMNYQHFLHWYCWVRVIQTETTMLVIIVLVLWVSWVLHHHLSNRIFFLSVGSIHYQTQRCSFLYYDINGFKRWFESWRDVTLTTYNYWTQIFVWLQYHSIFLPIGR